MFDQHLFHLEYSTMRLLTHCVLAAGILNACSNDQALAPTNSLFMRDSGTCAPLPTHSKSLSLSVSMSRLEVGATIPLEATNQNGVTVPSCALQWSSSNLAVATVNGSGLVTGVMPGLVAITAETRTRKPLSGAVALSIVSPPPDITSGLRAYYPFSGNAQDASGNGRHGTPASGAVLSADRVGNPASAHSFSGNLGFINIGQLDIPGAFTLSAWIRADHQLVGGVISKFATGGGQGYELLYAGEQLQHCMRLHTSGLRGTVGFDCGIALELGRWYHVAGTYDGVSIGRLYLDGVLVGESAGLLPDLFGGPETLIGRSAWGAQTFPGAVDEVRIYDRALTQEQVAHLRSIVE